MLYVLIPIYVIVCVFLILVVLLQQGKGADVASAFGASSSQTTFGARGATTLLEKITTWSFVVFSLLAVTISLVQSHPKSSVLSQQAGKKAAPAAPAPGTTSSAPSTAAAVPVTGGTTGSPATSAPAAPAPASAAPAAPATGAASPATK